MVIQRELRSLSRRPITYWGRFAAAVLAIFFMAQHSMMVDSGRDLFRAAVMLSFVLCILDAVRRGAATIADETREGTLGLLLLTPLSGKNLLFGKYASVMIASLPMALAIVPLFAVAILLGGVSGTEFVRASLALVHFQSIAVVLAVLTSSNSRSSGTAMVATLCILGVGLFMSGVLSAGEIFNPINPLTPIMSLFDLKVRWIAVISSILIWQLLLQLILREKGRNFSREWREAEEREVRFANYMADLRHAQAVPTTRIPPKIEKPSYDAIGTPKWFDQNPMEWLTLREMGMHTGPWVFSLAAALCCVFAILTPVGIFYTVLLTIGLSIFLCVASARPMAVARESNSLELIATTPLGVDGMIKGNIRAVRRIFLWPALIVVGTFGYFAFKELRLAPDSIIALYFLSGLTLFFLATPWIGMWMGLKCKSPLRAVLATLALVALVPRIGCAFADAPYFLVMLFLARSQVYRSVAHSPR